MSAPAVSERQSAVLLVAAPTSDWAPIAERLTHEEKDVVVLFTAAKGPTLAGAVRARMLTLAASGTALVAIASVGLFELDALRELAVAAKLPFV